MDNQDTKVKLGFILHSSAAFDYYMDATGKVPPKMPEGKNTLVTPFVVKDKNGIERAAALFYQTGFAETPEESANGDEASGLGVVVAEDIPILQGQNAIETFLDKILHKEER
ncbi:MAG: hypothetical protein IJI54_05900 [Kiritimatiellae bacterium]|nr:hypothetical protein [Kiritimatiellia bacterium]